MPTGSDIWKAYKARVLEAAAQRGSDIIGQQVRKQRRGSDGWIEGLCPLHDDHSPSFGFNPETGQWICFSGCGKGSNAIDFHMVVSGLPFKDAMLDLGDKLGIARPVLGRGSMRPPIPESLVKSWATNLWAMPEALRWLREKRGLSDETLRRYEIGWCQRRERNTIPIRDEHGNIVNVRLYNAKKQPKMLNYTEGKHRYGSPARLYGLDELSKASSGQVVWCEGEWDRLLLQQEGFAAVTGTGGCDSMRLEWAAWFKDRDVVIMFDCDEPGRSASKKAVALLKASGAKSVKSVALPLRGDKDDKDVTDYLHKRGLDAAGLKQLIDDTPAHSYEAERASEPTVELSSFVEIEAPQNIDRRVKCELTVCGETSEAYHAVESFRVSHCTGMAKGDCAECKGFHEPEQIPRSSREYIGCCMASDQQVIALLREYGCKHQRHPKLDVLSRTTVKDFFAHQRVHRITQVRDEEGNVVQLLDGHKQELVERRVFYLSDQRPKPGSYQAEGWVKTNPKTQQATLLIESMTALEDDFESFVTGEHLDELTAFRKLDTNAVLADLTENVTRIFERDEILLAALLTYCSPRWVTFNGEVIRGWLVSVIIGDPGSGKTQVCQRLSEFLGVGDTFSGLTGSRTGLTYALVEHKQKGWQVRIGRYPANSRKLLIVDECQHLHREDVRNLSKAMEEGFLQIDRVLSKGYESQTRLIMVANPKDDAVMDSFSFGCEALSSIFPPTIIRRIDLAVFANSSDIEGLELVNRVRPVRQRRVVAPEMLRSAIYWSWNLKPNQVEFEGPATRLCLAEATRLAERYGWAGDVPLVTRADFRNNLARLAASWAVLRVSAPDDFSRLVVTTEHVGLAVRFLEQVYSHDSCQLDEHSKRERAMTQLEDYEAIEEALLTQAKRGKHAAEEAFFSRIVKVLYMSRQVHREEVAAQVGCDEKTVRRTVQTLRGYGLVDSSRNGYSKTAKANRFFRRFSDEHPGFFEDLDPVHEDSMWSASESAEAPSE